MKKCKHCRKDFRGDHYCFNRQRYIQYISTDMSFIGVSNDSSDLIGAGITLDLMTDHHHHDLSSSVDTSSSSCDTSDSFSGGGGDFGGGGSSDVY